MENHRRRPGRPKAAPRTTPLVLEAELNLSKIEVALPTTTTASLAEYVAWVQLCSGKTAEEALTTTVDFALCEIFRRDRLWRDERRGSRSNPEPLSGVTASPPPSGAPVALAPGAPFPRSLPPATAR
jgi:hypothetical protein